MELFSLEDDYRDIFITQSDKVVNDKVNESNESSGKSVIFGDPLDFSSPCVSLVSSTSDVHYSDISDDDNFDIPSSQKHDVTEKKTR